MNLPIRFTHLRLVGGAALLTALLAACTPGPSTYVPPITVSFSYPAGTDTSGLTLAAYGYTGTGKVKVLARAYGGGGYQAYTSPAVPTPTQNPTIVFSDYVLSGFLSPNGDNCRAYRAPASTEVTNVTVTPADVKTCLVYFAAFRDTNNNGLPESGEVEYMTHDVFSNASTDYTYTAASPDGKISETGSITAGWTLVHHTVLQPSGAPGQYKVSMHSVPTDDLGIPVQLHAPSEYLKSLSLAGVQGGVK